MQEEFRLETLPEFEGGKVRAAFNKHVTRAAMDCYDRPGDKKPRTVLLQVEFLPVTDQEGNLDTVAITVGTTSKVPPHHTKPVSAALRAGGMLVFDHESPDDVNQASLPYRPDRD